MKIAILVFPGVEELDFVGFLEALAVANRIKGKKYFEINVVGTEDGPIVCGGGMKVVPDQTLSSLGEHDLLFVPGGGASRDIGVDLLMKNEEVLARLAKSYEEGKKVWSVCTGGLVLAKAGLLKGREAVTHHAYLDELESSGAKVVERRTVTDGRITTGGGISSSIDVGLLLVEMELGEDFKREVQKRMEYPPPATRYSKNMTKRR
jgi:transcriptional regulator GlxA family with amidase domain